MCIYNFLKDWAPVWGPLLAAAIAIVGLVIAYRAFRLQNRQFEDSINRLRQSIEFVRETRELEILRGYEQQYFYNKAFMESRKRAIESIKNGSFVDAEDILDFFETIAMLVNRKKLDAELVWHTFSWWIHRYWVATQSHITEKRKVDPTLWHDLGQFYPKMMEIEKKENPKHKEDLSAEELQEFYANEP
jgi:hypothetical protein